MYAGLALIGILLVMIFVSWLVFSKRWDEEESILDFLRKNPDKCIQKDVLIAVHPVHVVQHGYGSDSYYDVFWFEGGILFSPRQYAGGFGKFIYLRDRNMEFVDVFKQCDFTGELERPRFAGEKVIFAIILHPGRFPNVFDMEYKISLVPDERLRSKLESIPL